VKLLAMKGLPSDSEDNFLAYFAEAAMEQQRLYGIPASVTLAQMALESKWGRSSLARTNNNYFGIKASSQWLASQRPIVYHTDDKPNEKFCVFSDVWESMEYHSRLLMGKRYSVCHQFNEQEYHGWLLGIKASGYATAKDYVLRCEQIIKKHKLYLFDQIAMTL
jgi:flagellum-specific peptidoglycan hydrolase FlgJ